MTGHRHWMSFFLPKGKWYVLANGFPRNVNKMERLQVPVQASRGLSPSGSNSLIDPISNQSTAQCGLGKGHRLSYCVPYFASLS